MNETPIESFDDSRWLSLISRIEEQVKSDKEYLVKEFRDKVNPNEQKLKAKLDELDKEYLFPRVYPEICCKPEYLLLGMEPSGPREGAEKVSFFPLFIHYCAYKYLCKKEFDGNSCNNCNRKSNCKGKFRYYITDLVKRRKTDIEKDQKEELRWSKWLPLFKDEWHLLGEPKIIVMSKMVYDKIKNEFKDKNGKTICDFVYHYTDDPTKKSYKLLKEEYDKYILSQSNSYKLNETELEEFAKKLEEHLGSKPEISLGHYKKMINDTLYNEYHREIVFPVYSYQFEQVAKGEEIPHIKRQQEKEFFKALDLMC